MPPPATLGLRNRAHWPLPSASSVQPRPSKWPSIGARSSPPTPPLTVLLAARSMAVTIGRICLLLGRQDALLMAETRLWRDADETREREGGGAKQRDKEELSKAVCSLGLSGWLAGATGRRSPLVAEAKVDQKEHMPI